MAVTVQQQPGCDLCPCDSHRRCSCVYVHVCALLYVRMDRTCCCDLCPCDSHRRCSCVYVHVCALLFVRMDRTCCWQEELGLHPTLARKCPINFSELDDKFLDRLSVHHKRAVPNPPPPPSPPPHFTPPHITISLTSVPSVS